MRWATNKPDWGAVRRRKVFAFLPIECDNGETVWLEWVERTEVLYNFIYGPEWSLAKTIPVRGSGETG